MDFLQVALRHAHSATSLQTKHVPIHTHGPLQIPSATSPAFINQQQQKERAKNAKVDQCFSERLHLYIKLYGKPNLSEGRNATTGPIGLL
ncbi:hypothetical protein niasHT_023822 [Heterodera trifolii]|uniref:Uncharacterized protein n=1 Tax=Heterodera trifolii TaxID=157864 RepID=A0ABD2JCF2_9BILA